MRYIGEGIVFKSFGAYDRWLAEYFYLKHCSRDIPEEKSNQIISLKEIHIEKEMMGNE